MTAPDREGPQPLPVRFTCTGCKHLVTEYWKDYLDNDDTDSGTSAKCAKADKHISAYWNDGNRPPDWCPCPRAPLAEALAVPSEWNAVAVEAAADALKDMADTALTVRAQEHATQLRAAILALIAKGAAE